MPKLHIPFFRPALTDVEINEVVATPRSGWLPGEQSVERFEESESSATRLKYLLSSIIGLALVLRLYGIALYPMVGDEYSTILEAERVGLSWNSIIYFALMHFWFPLGTSEFWLRLPAAIFGVATVAVLFKVGEKLGGWRAGMTAAVLAATSPFNVFHSQEVRFYSFFMLAVAVFMLATISYIESSKSWRGRLWIVSAGVFLIFSQFFGAIALFAQGIATFLAAKKWRPLTILAGTSGPVLLIFGLPILSPVRSLLLHIYTAFGNAPNADLSAKSISLINLVKLASAGYVFLFGYHVYPLRLVLVVPGLALCGLLLVCGVRRLFKESRWAALPFAYLVAIAGVYAVLDSLNSVGVAPRHTSFVWPAFVVLLALGLSSFKRKSFQFLLAAMLLINASSLVLGWQKDWTYGIATDHRAAGAYLSSWADKDSAMILDRRAYEVSAYYFPQNVPLVTARPGSAEFTQLSYRRLLLVTNDWRAQVRQQADDWMSQLANDFTVIDGRVEYPLFQYVLERKSAPGGANSLAARTEQLQQPVSIYGIEFQDLQLPVTVNVSNVPLKVIGAYRLPNYVGANEVVIPVSRPMQANRLILLTNVVGSQTQPGVPIAEVTVENQSGLRQTFPLRLNQETASWSEACQTTSTCKTVFQWHKRIAITGRLRFPDAWRDFQAGMHGASFELTAGTEVKKVSVRYLAQAGNLYIWGIALSSN